MLFFTGRKSGPFGHYGDRQLQDTHQSAFEPSQKRGVGFRSINDGSIDTTTTSGEMIFNIFDTLAQFERRLIQDHTQAGLTTGRARGRKGGRAKISNNNPKVQMEKK